MNSSSLIDCINQKIQEDQKQEEFTSVVCGALSTRYNMYYVNSKDPSTITVASDACTTKWSDYTVGPSQTATVDPVAEKFAALEAKLSAMQSQMVVMDNYTFRLERENAELKSTLRDIQSRVGELERKGFQQVSRDQNDYHAFQQMIRRVEAMEQTVRQPKTQIYYTGQGTTGIGFPGSSPTAITSHPTPSSSEIPQSVGWILDKSPTSQLQGTIKWPEARSLTWDDICGTTTAIATSTVAEAPMTKPFNAAEIFEKFYLSNSTIGAKIQ